MEMHDIPFGTTNWDDVPEGHILYVLEGVLHTQLDDGKKVTLVPGTSYQVADNTGAHRSFTETGARLFIVD